MANQAIALQARAPQMPNIGSAMQQSAQMINMMAQQKAAERQAAQVQQKMQLEQEAAGREAEKAKLDRSALVYAEFRRLAPVVAEGGPEVYRDWLAAYGEAEPRVASVIAKAMPPERFNKDAFVLMMGSMDQRFDARYGKAITKELIDPEGNVFGANISGIPGATYAVPVPDISRPVGERGAPPTDAPSAPALAPSSGGVSARPTRGANTTPQDLLRQGVDPRSIPMGNPLVKPISFEGGEVEPLTVENAPQIVQAAIDSGFIDPSHVEQLKQMVGPENGAAVDQWVQQSGLKMGSGVPGARSAVYRPQAQDFGAPVADDGMPFEGPRAPMGQQVQYNPNDYAPVRVKSPMQSPTPGQYNVPLPVVRGHAGAEEGGKQDVRVVTDPKIEAGKARVVRLEKLRGEMPVALSQSQALVNDLTDRIKAIDDFLRNPYRNTIIGSIEGRIPRLLQSEKRADAQAQFDYITNNTVLDKLISDRQSTETGASPQGIVSDTDLKVAAQAATKLTQTGSERAQEIEMQRLRDVLYRTREQALQKYNNVYREVLKDAPELRIRVKPVTPRYKAYPNGQSQGKKVGQFMVTEVRD